MLSPPLRGCKKLWQVLMQRCKSQPRPRGTAKVPKRNGKIPSRLLQIPVEEEAKGHRDPAGAQEVRLGAISSEAPPCAHQPHLAPFTHLSRQISRFHSLLLANGNVVNSPRIIHAVETNTRGHPCPAKVVVSHTRGDLSFLSGTNSQNQMEGTKR